MDGTLGHVVKVLNCIVKFQVNVYSSINEVIFGCRKYVEPTVISHSYGSDEFNNMFFTQVSLLATMA